MGHTSNTALSNRNVMEASNVKKDFSRNTKSEKFPHKNTCTIGNVKGHSSGRGEKISKKYQSIKIKNQKCCLNDMD